MERYENLGVVGEGSYGIVLRCRHRESGQIVAIKKFLESEDDQTVKKIALREVRTLKRLRHENLVNLIEFFRRKRRLYLVFEFVDHTILDELESTEGGLDKEKCRTYIFQVLRGIAFCHLNQIIHRDVKPENVLVSLLGVVKLCDFGFARLLRGPGESCTEYVATRWYRAPELLVGDTRYGKEVDIWAVGCLLAEMLTGDPLFPGESDIDQLFHIVQTLGELSIPHRTLVEKNPMMAGLHLPIAASTPLTTTYPTWPARTHIFISACLRLSPDDRPSAEDLLSHDFFTHDKLPENFLPILREKVQQEFNSNVLLQNSRKITSSGDRKGRRFKGGHSDSPDTTSKAHAVVTRSENLALTKALKPYCSEPPQKPSVTFISLTNNRTAAGNFVFEETPTNVPSSLMPHLQDIFLPTPHTFVSSPAENISLEFSATSQFGSIPTLTTCNANSPSRGPKQKEKAKRSPVTIPKSHNLVIQGQGPNPPEDDDYMATDASCKPAILHKRMAPSDSTRHPYAISLDRTRDPFRKDTIWKDFSRDPLREIKENSRTMFRGPPKDPSVLLRKPRLEITGWARPRLPVNEICLPNVAVPQLTLSPKKSRMTTVNAPEDETLSVRGRAKASGGVIMPNLTSIVTRNSATSSECTPPCSPMSNLPFV